MKLLLRGSFAVGLFLVTILLITAFIILFSYSGYSYNNKFNGVLQDSTLKLTKLTVK